MWLWPIAFLLGWLGHARILESSASIAAILSEAELKQRHFGKILPPVAAGSRNAPDLGKVPERSLLPGVAAEGTLQSSTSPRRFFLCDFRNGGSC